MHNIRKGPEKESEVHFFISQSFINIHNKSLSYLFRLYYQLKDHKNLVSFLKFLGLSQKTSFVKIQQPNDPNYFCLKSSNPMSPGKSFFYAPE